MNNKTCLCGQFLVQANKIVKLLSWTPHRPMMIQIDFEGDPFVKTLSLLQLDIPVTEMSNPLSPKLSQSVQPLHCAQ